MIPAEIQTVTPAEAAERGQDGLAAGIRFLKNIGLLGGGIRIEHLLNILRFGSASYELPSNRQPFNQVEFFTAFNILQQAASISYDSYTDILGLIFHLGTKTPCDDSVTLVDRSLVIGSAQTLAAPTTTKELEDLAQYLSKEYELRSTTDSFTPANTNNADQKSEVANDKQPSRTQQRIIDALLSETTVFTDGLAADAGQLKNLTRSEFLLVAKKLIAMAANREVAARAMMHLALGPHADEVTVELRTDSMSRLYRELSRPDLMASALQTSEQIALRGFKSRIDLIKESEDD